MTLCISVWQVSATSYDFRRSLDSCLLVRLLPKINWTETSVWFEFRLVDQSRCSNAVLDLRFNCGKYRMVHLYKKLHKAVKTLEYFTQNQWIFMQDNTSQLRDSLSPLDAQVNFAWVIQANHKLRMCKNIYCVRCAIAGLRYWCAQNSMGRLRTQLLPGHKTFRFERRFG